MEEQIKQEKEKKQDIKIKVSILLTLVIILIIATTETACLIPVISAEEVIPKIVPYVNDFAHLMSQDQIDKLNLQADDIENRTSFEIAIVTVPTTNGIDRILFANKIGDLNGVGKKKIDNGLVLLWTEDNEQGGAIAVGRGAESIFNDAKVGTIVRAARSYYDDGNFYEGFEYELTQIDTELIRQNIAFSNQSNNFNTTLVGNSLFNSINKTQFDKSNNKYIVNGILIIFILIMVIIIICRSILN
jgi:uncharacterized membrane protein YgcG